MGTGDEQPPGIKVLMIVGIGDVKRVAVAGKGAGKCTRETCSSIWCEEGGRLDELF